MGKTTSEKRPGILHWIAALRRRWQPEVPQKTGWWIVLALSVVPICFRQVSVSDAWWHAALGRWFLTKGQWPDLAQFYFTPTDSSQLARELRWTWLGDVFLGMVYGVLGSAGFQLVSLACLWVALIFLVRVAARHCGPWTILLFVLVMLGTYQLQLPRNSVFSLALFPLILWLGRRNPQPPTWSEYGVIAGVLAFWSCLHGSCLLGWLTALVLFGERACRGFREDLQKGWRQAGTCAAVFALTLMLLIAGRPGALAFLLEPMRHVTTWSQPIPATPVAAPASSPPVSAEASPPAPSSLTKIKSWLNATVWKPEAGVPWSNDFQSPFDFPASRPIEATVLLAMLALVAGLLVFRQIGLGLTLAWTGSTLLALGYIRMLGYASLVSAAILLSTRIFDRMPERVAGKFRMGGWVLTWAWVAFAWWAFLGGRWDRLLPEGQHVSRWGQVPIYDDRLCDWVRREFPREPAFTTIDSGSHCLLRWGFEKPVFVDGFFAPHTREVWQDYLSCQESGDLSVLHRRYGVQVAVIPSGATRWLEAFCLSPEWYPVAMDTGAVVFLHASVPQKGRTPQLFCNAEALRATAARYRVDAVNALMLIFDTAAASPMRFTEDQWISASPKTFGELNQFILEGGATQ